VPLYLRLGRRMRGPEGVPVGTLKRIIISDVVSYNSVSSFGGAGLIWGLADHPIEDVKIHDVYMDHRGGGTAEMASRIFQEKDTDYPEPYRVGTVPASGFYVRNVDNIEFTNVELAWKQPDARPAIGLHNVNGADFFRIKTPKQISTPMFALTTIEDFRVTSSRNVADTQLSGVTEKTL
jgi:hypothetical protein